jgi:hypothetical protein
MVSREEALVKAVVKRQGADWVQLFPEPPGFTKSLALQAFSRVDKTRSRITRGNEIRRRFILLLRSRLPSAGPIPIKWLLSKRKGDSYGGIIASKIVMSRHLYFLKGRFSKRERAAEGVACPTKHIRKISPLYGHGRVMGSDQANGFLG